MGESWKSRGTFLVLLALKGGGKHGYEIATWLEERSQGFFRLSFGALYPILHKLEKDGLIEGRWEGDDSARRRKVYVLTAQGKASLKEERERYDALAGAFARLLGSKA